MPRYDRHCLECDDIFEVICKISEKDDVHRCPYCDATDGEWLISSTMIVNRSDRLMSRSGVSNGFNDVLKKIGDRHPRSELSKR